MNSKPQTEKSLAPNSEERPDQKILEVSKQEKSQEIGSNSSKTSDSLTTTGLESGPNEDAAKLQKHLLTPLLSKKIPPSRSEEEKPLWPKTIKHFFRYIFFWWMFPVLNVGYKRTLQNTDLWKLTDNLTVEKLYADFKTKLDSLAEKNREKALKKNPDLNEEELFAAGFTNLTIPIALYYALWRKYGLAVGVKIIFDVGSALNPLLVKKLLTFVQKKANYDDLPVGPGVGYAIGVCLMVLVSGIAINHFFDNSMSCGVQAKAILTKLLLEKSFRLSGASRQKFSTGKITSLMGTDLARVDLAFGFQPFLICFPIPTTIIIALLIVNIGVSALVGIGIFIVAVMIIVSMSKLLVKYRLQTSVLTDKRVSLVREVLNSIKMIKYYGWEVPYHERIEDTRRKEMNKVFSIQRVRVVFQTIGISLPVICSVVSFLVVYSISKGRSAADIFSSLTLFNVLSQQVFMVPMAVGTSIDAFLGLRRVRNFVAASEEEEETQDTIEEECKEFGLVKDDEMAIQLRSASFEWNAVVKEEEDQDRKDGKDEEKVKEKVKEEDQTVEKEDTPDINEERKSFKGLVDLNFDIKSGEFIIVTGQIGSGKSSFLQALAGFMPKISGAKLVNQSLLLCGYPWVQNATVRDNILFGEEFDADKYSKVIHSCALAADLDILPAGDRTEVGERGITLSGGQKARINLARAVYNHREIILLDDVLSAVDARVGKHIMESCILGFLKNRTRVLATHQLSLIHNADRVIFLKGDGSAIIGTLDELKAKEPDFTALMEYSKESADASSESDAVDEEDQELSKEVFNENDGKIMQVEDRAVNSISFDVYSDYLGLGLGRFKWVFVGLLVIEISFATFCQLFTNTWMSFWIDQKFARPDKFYIGLYVMFGTLSVVFLYFQSYFVNKIANASAREINIKAIKNVLYTPMSFLDTTPMGRILNRFTKDTDSLDNEIANEIQFLLYTLAVVVGVLILSIIYQPWLAIAVPFLGAIYVSVTSFYQASAREVKRLEALNRSMVYNNFNECLSGSSIIKAYGLKQSFIDKNDRLINQMDEASYVNVSVQRFLSIQFVLVALCIILIVSLLCVTGQFNISAASTGLVLAYLLQIVGLLSMLIRSLTQVENEMNSAERLIHYVRHLPKEAPYEIPETEPPASWPDHGAIKFNNASMRYRDGLPLVLKHLSLDIQPGEKIGICGRTGAGKSSIMTVLYRLSELAEGSVLIDGIDISTIGLKNLRSCLTIIPQDPVLFKGSIRRNLDPFGVSTDDKLWDSLRRSGLIDGTVLEQVKTQKMVNDDLTSLHKFHLDQQVEEEGSNFSLGEKQLIALARALVRESKILILDEATSSVDYETDANINKTIRSEFSQCTILCIAHRLNTIVKFDRILVMDAGEVAQFGTPPDLYKEKGIFREMCDGLNIVEDDFKSDL